MINQPFQNEVTVVPFAIMSDKGLSLKFIIYEAFTEFLDTVVYVFISFKSCVIERLTVWVPVMGSFEVIKYVLLCVGST